MRSVLSGKPLFSFICFPVLLLFSAACANIQYEGISEAALPSDAPVLVFFDQSQIKAHDYATLGTARWETAPSTSRNEIISTLKKFARKHGANAILIQAMDRIKTGEARQDQIYNLNAPGWDVEDNSNSSYTYVKDTIFYSGGGRDPEKAIYSLLVKASLLHFPETVLSQYKNAE